MPQVSRMTEVVLLIKPTKSAVAARSHLVERVFFATFPSRGHHSV